MALRFLPMFGALIAAVLLPTIAGAANLDDAFVTCSTRNADFDAAVPFAELVFKANPDDPEANWAIGMHHFQQRNFVHAEPFLANCLKARPDDPAVLNNLAIAEREIGRLDAAEHHIREGLERLPDSPHLHRTLDSILKAKGEK